MTTFSFNMGHNQGPPLQCDVPVYITPQGEVFAIHRPFGDIPNIRQPVRVPPLKADAINPQNIPDPDPEDYDDQGRFIGLDPERHLKEAIAEFALLNSTNLVVDASKYGLPGKRRDKWGVAVMS